MNTGRRDFLKYIGAGLTGIGLGRYQKKGFRPRELAHDQLSYDGVPDLYLEHGLLEDELKPQYANVLENFTPGEENVLVDFLVVEDMDFDTDIVERLAKEFEDEGINFGFFERLKIIDRREYEQISRPEELIGDPRSPVELLGADNDLMDEKISDIMLESAIQVAVTPEVELTSPTGGDADGYAYRSKAVVTPSRSKPGLPASKTRDRSYPRITPFRGHCYVNRRTSRDIQ